MAWLKIWGVRGHVFFYNLCTVCIISVEMEKLKAACSGGWEQVENGFRGQEGELRLPQASGWAATGLRWHRSHTSHFLSLLTLWGSLSCQYHSVCTYSASVHHLCMKASVTFVSGKLLLFFYPGSQRIHVFCFVLFFLHFQPVWKRQETNWRMGRIHEIIHDIIQTLADLDTMNPGLEMEPK